MTRMEDHGEEVRPLLRLAATALASNPSAELKLTQTSGAESPILDASDGYGSLLDSSDTSSLLDQVDMGLQRPKRECRRSSAVCSSSSPATASPSAAAAGTALPLPCSQALFDSYREAADAVDDSIDPAALRTFTDGVGFPLESLNLEGCNRLDDRCLTKLLRAQQHSLRSLNISGCESLTHRLSGQLRRLRMDKLTHLTLGYSHHILGSWFDDPESLYEPSIFAGVESLLGNTGSCTNCGLPKTELGAEGQGDPSTSSNPTTSAMDDVKEALGPDDVPESEIPGPSSSSFHDGSRGADEEEPTWTDLSYASSAAAAGLRAEDSLMEEEEEAEEADEDEDEEAEEDGGGKKETSRAEMAVIHRMVNQLHKRVLRSRPNQEPGMSPPITAIAPALRSLICYGFSLEENHHFKDSVPNVLRNLLSPLKKLGHLDLSYWEGVEDGRFLRPHSNTLVSLVLYNVPNIYEAIDTIGELRHLVALDVSQGKKETGIYPRPVSTLYNLVRKLRNLRYLDISSTNLASPPSTGDDPLILEDGLASSIPALRGLSHRLAFLGLYNCEAAPRHPNLPADQVTGDASEAQVLLALETYMDRQELLRDVLNEVYTVYRFGGADAAEGVEQTRALHLVLEAMRRYLTDATTQIAGSASLFYIIKPVQMRPSTRQKVVRTLLSGMEEHMEEQVMVRNCCLSLCQVEIPGDVLFDYQRAARLLIGAVNSPGIDDMTQKVVVYLLNSMACHVEGEQKSQVGGMGAVESVLRQIRRRVEEGNCDEVMEVAWSFLWNITDETPGNCERFLKAQGLELFHSAYQKFPDQKELVRNMMGLMGNIAEVAEQRAALRQPDYIRIFVELLSNLSDGIEISYNSAGVLAHILSDPVSDWCVAGLGRAEVSEAVVSAIRKWELAQKRFINYRSFGPILRLLRLDEGQTSPASLHWGVWALANLTTVDGVKYCEFVHREGGEPLLQAITKAAAAGSPLVTPEVADLAATVLRNILLWNRNELVPLESDDQMEEDMEV